MYSLKPLTPDTVFPVEVIFTPVWWNKNCGISFDRDFFFHPSCRVDSEKRMREYLYERYGDIGLGEKYAGDRPVIGPVHLAAGFFTSQLLGCDIRFNESGPPDVIAANMSDSEIMKLEVPDFQKALPMKQLVEMMDILESKYGYIEGDIDWNGVQNTALDLRGEQLFVDYFENNELVEHLFTVISRTLVKFVNYMKKRTDSSSISVNPFVRHFKPSVNLHSNCSLTMISHETFDEFLLEYENYLAINLQPYGIHFCGKDLERFAASFAKVYGAHYFDVGWGSNIRKCRSQLPNAFFNLRLSPAKMLQCNAGEVEADVLQLVKENGGVENAGICCINMDYNTPDENIRTIFRVAKDLRNTGKEFLRISQ